MAYVLPGTEGASGSRGNRWAVVVILAGLAVATFLGVYARVHQSANRPAFGLGASMLTFKAWMTTAAVVLGVVQLLTALRLRDRLPWPRNVPVWLNDAHRLSGTLALLCSLPVAYHCLWSLGFQFDGAAAPRVLIHAVAGCFLYGVFVTKMLTVRIDAVSRWLIPVAGGALFVALVVVWLTSAAYFFTGRMG